MSKKIPVPLQVRNFGAAVKKAIADGKTIGSFTVDGRSGETDFYARANRTGNRLCLKGVLRNNGVPNYETIEFCAAESGWEDWSVADTPFAKPGHPLHYLYKQGQKLWKLFGNNGKPVE